MSFESIGDNCEFGLMQRTVGTERMGLLRYAGIYDLRPFIALPRRRFEGFCEGDDLKITTFGPEWMADIGSASLNPHRAHGRSRRRAEDVRLPDDHRQRGGPDGTYGMDELYDATRSYGDCALLWVTLADEAHPHATVERVRDRLYRGYIRRLCPYDDAHSADERAWLDLLAVARDEIAARMPVVAAG